MLSEKQCVDVKSIAASIRDNVDDLVKILEDSCVPTHGLLLVSDDIENHAALIACCKPGVSVWVYSRKWTLKEFNKHLDTHLAEIPDASLKLCGWVFHGMDSNFSMVSDMSIKLHDGRNIAQWQHVIDFMLKIKAKMMTKRLDLLACSLAKNPSFKFARDMLEMVTGLYLTSSDDNTGNVEGADWELESGDVNLIGTYFMEDTEERLRSVPIHMWMSFTQNYASPVPLPELAEVIVLGVNWLADNPKEALGTVFNMLSLVPGPIGIAAGLGSLAITIVDYHEKLKNGNASDLDHADFALAVAGSAMSFFPGGKAISNAGNAAARKSIKKVANTSANGMKKGTDAYNLVAMVDSEIDKYEKDASGMYRHRLMEKMWGERGQLTPASLEALREIVSGTVTFYEHSRFEGRVFSQSTSMANLPKDDSANYGFDKKFSSLIIQPYTELTVYEHPQWRGASHKWVNPGGERMYIDWIGETWNDRISSFNVIPIKQTGKAILYEHYNQDGQSMVVRGANHWIGGEWNDRVSSVVLSPRTRLVLYEHSNFQGQVYTVDNWSNDGTLSRNLEGWWNDQISGYRVETI